MSSSGRRTHWLVELLIVLVVALTVSALVRAFVAQAFYIPSASMEDTLEVGDWIVVNKIGNHLGTPQRGDVVVFRDPGGWLPDVEQSSNPLRRALEFVGVAPDSAEGDLVKRVVGVGGDHVTCCDAKGRVQVNGTPLDETYLFPGDEPGDAPVGCRGSFDIRVPLGFLWVMGDHRSVSEDSRCQSRLDQFVPEDNLQGRTVAVVWPFDRWALVGRPATFDDIAPSGAG